MNARFYMVLVLTLIAVLSGGGLALWDGHTRPMIEANLKRELEKGIAKVLPPHQRYEEIQEGQTTYYVGYQEDQPIGVALKTVGPGFQGKVTVMVGLKPDFNAITGIEVIEQIETPGLGTKIVVDPSNKADAYWFPNQFKGVLTDQPIATIKNQKPTNPHQIEAITGATISSKAVADILSKGISAARPGWNQAKPQELKGE